MELIKIGTCIPLGTLDKMIPFAIKNGFSSASLNIHMKKIDKNFFPSLAEEARRLIGDSDLRISTIGYYCNPLADAEYAEMLAYAIDSASLFGADMVSTFAGAIPGKPVDESYGKFKEVFGDLVKRAEQKGIKVAIECCPMGGTWKNATCNIGFNPRAWTEMFSAVSSDSFGLEWEPTHQMSQLIDPVENLKEWVGKVVHIHGKDANIDRAAIAKYGVSGAYGFCRDRFPGMGDTDWRSIFTVLYNSGYAGEVLIEGFHDPIFRRELEEKGQLLSLDYLRRCSGNV